MIARGARQLESRCGDDLRVIIPRVLYFHIVLYECMSQIA